MKASDLRNKSAAELNNELLERRKEQFNLRMQQSTGQLTRPDRLKGVRREIARIKTVLNESHRAGEST
jgi:large subunit ribosomal protein L29